MRKETILVVEDEEDISELVCFTFEQSGYRVLSAETGTNALGLVQSHEPDLVVLDIMLPGKDGMEVCRILRQSERTRKLPIVMLTARVDEIDRVLGFELGADDYVPKPFSPRELVLRVKAILNRIRPSAHVDDVIRINQLTIDKPKHRVLANGDLVDLTATEFNLLLTLVERKGRVQTRDMLLESVWGYDYGGFTRTVDTHIRRIRSKLGTTGDCIETVRGVGYRVV